MNQSQEKTENTEDNFLYILEDEQSDDKKKEPEKPAPGAWALFFEVLFRPVSGWKTVKSSRIKVDNFAQSCFYPLLALCACSNFLDLVYNPDASLQTTLIESLIIFVSFFLGYFLAIVFIKILMPYSKDVFEKNYGKVFVMLSMASLAFFNIFMLVFPMFEPVFLFFSLYTIYIINKGVKTLRLPNEQIIRTNITLFITIIFTPYLVKWAFSFLLKGL